MITRSIINMSFFILCVLLGTLIVLLQSKTYAYKVHSWKKTFYGHSTIIDQYFPQRQGYIQELQYSTNFFNFKMFSSQNKTSQSPMIIVKAYLNPNSIDNKGIPSITVNNIPVNMKVYLKMSKPEGYNEQPAVTILQVAIFAFSMSKIQFQLNESVYDIEINASIKQQPLLFAQKSRKQIKVSDQWILIFSFNIVFQMFLVSIFILLKEQLLYRFLTLFNTMTGYQMSILLYILELLNLDVFNYYMVISYSSLGLVITYFVYLFRQFSWKKIVVVLVMVAYCYLLALGQIGELWMLTQLFLQQMIFTAQNVSQKALIIESRQNLGNSILSSLLLLAIIKLVFFIIFELLGDGKVTFQKDFICLVLLLIVIQQALIGNCQAIIHNIFRKICHRNHAQNKYQKIQMKEQIN